MKKNKKTAKSPKMLMMKMPKKMPMGVSLGKTARNFKSKAAYQKWLAHGHIHGDFARSPGNTPVKIQGKPHKVKHST